MKPSHIYYNQKVNIFILFIYRITVLPNAKKKNKKKKLKQKGKGKKRDDRYVDPSCILTKHYAGFKKKKKKKSKITNTKGKGKIK